MRFDVPSVARLSDNSEAGIVIHEEEDLGPVEEQDVGVPVAQRARRVDGLGQRPCLAANALQELRSAPDRDHLTTVQPNGLELSCPAKTPSHDRAKLAGSA